LMKKRLTRTFRVESFLGVTAGWIGVGPGRAEIIDRI
jgi:hypothetical protein